MTSIRRDMIFLNLIILLSIPFYLLGAYFPVEGLPLDLPIIFLMVFVQGLLAVLFLWRYKGWWAVVVLLLIIFYNQSSEKRKV